MVVTDSTAPREEVERWRDAGVEVLTVDPGPRGAAPPRPRDLRRPAAN
jgi:hypothetical protein